MAVKKGQNAKSDAKKGASRFADQVGQWTDRTPASVKKKQAQEWKKLEKMMSTSKKKKR